MLQYFQNITATSLTLGDFLINILVALCCGLIHITFYRLAYKGPGYTVNYLNSLVLLTMITAVVIMVIGDSLARAFGLVGAMSIIRFRTAVKDVMDIVHIFFALAIGMAAGVGMVTAAFTGTIVLGIIYYLLAHGHVIATRREQFVVQVIYRPQAPDQNGHDAEYVGVLNRLCMQSTLLNVRSINTNDDMEISYFVRPKSSTHVTELIRQLKHTHGVQSVTVFNEEENL